MLELHLKGIIYEQKVFEQIIRFCIKKHILLAIEFFQVSK